ncbi:MAG: hypothetical protein U0234_25500 [Sandaracinus sp.]
MEDAALVDALAQDAAEPAPDAIFVDARVAELEASLAGVDDPDARMTLRFGALDKGYSELRANVDLLPAQFLSTAQALRTAVLLSPAALADADAAFARARACGATPGPFAAAAPSCPPLAYAVTPGDREVARGVSPQIAAARRAADPLPASLRPRRPVATRTVLEPAPGPTVAVDVGGAP